MPLTARIGCTRSNSTDTECTPRLDAGGVQILTRRGNDWTEKYPAIAKAIAGLAAHNAYLDGELCGVLSDGKRAFNLIQNATDTGEGSLVFFFDLLHLNGENLTALPLVGRKTRLASLLNGAPDCLCYNDHQIGHGPAFIKCLKREEFVVVGWRTPRAAGIGLGGCSWATTPRRQAHLRGPHRHRSAPGKVGQVDKALVLKGFSCPIWGLPSLPVTASLRRDRALDRSSLGSPQARGNFFDRHLRTGEQFPRVGNLVCRRVTTGFSLRDSSPRELAAKSAWGGTSASRRGGVLERLLIGLDEHVPRIT
jgi:hypothetical protein